MPAPAREKACAWYDFWVYIQHQVLSSVCQLVSYSSTAHTTAWCGSWDISSAMALPSMQQNRKGQLGISGDWCHLQQAGTQQHSSPSSHCSGVHAISSDPARGDLRQLNQRLEHEADVIAAATAAATAAVCSPEDILQFSCGPLPARLDRFNVNGFVLTLCGTSITSLPC